MLGDVRMMAKKEKSREALIYHPPCTYTTEPSAIHCIHSLNFFSEHLKGAILRKTEKIGTYIIFYVISGCPGWESLSCVLCAIDKYRVFSTECCEVGRWWFPPIQLRQKRSFQVLPWPPPGPFRHCLFWGTIAWLDKVELRVLSILEEKPIFSMYFNPLPAQCLLVVCTVKCIWVNVLLQLSCLKLVYRLAIVHRFDLKIAIIAPLFWGIIVYLCALSQLSPFCDVANMTNHHLYFTEEKIEAQA